MSPENPVTISIVGTGSGDGGGVAPTPNGTTAITPPGQPDLRIQVITPIVAIAVRAANVFVASLLASLAAGVSGKTLWFTAGGAAGVETLKNLVTIFGRLEGKYPLATGSI